MLVPAHVQGVSQGLFGSFRPLAPFSLFIPPLPLSLPGCPPLLTLLISRAGQETVENCARLGANHELIPSLLPPRILAPLLPLLTRRTYAPHPFESGPIANPCRFCALCSRHDDSRYVG